MAAKTLDRAMHWMRDVLKDGPRPSTEVKREAKRRGVSVYALDQARKLLGVKTVRDTTGPVTSPHLWVLEPGPPDGGAPEIPAAALPEPSPGEPPEPAPPTEAGIRPEDDMAATTEELAKSLETLQTQMGAFQKELTERLGKIEARAVPLDSLTQPVREVLQGVQEQRAQVKAGEVLQQVVEKVTDLEKKVTPPDPRVTTLAEKADVLAQLCELHPALCKLLEPKPEPAPPAPPAAPLPAEQAHGKILGALEKAGIESLGRVPTWSDLMDLCPGGECREGVLDALVRHPDLLKKLAGREGAAEALIEGLKEAGKLTLEPEAPKPPGPEEVASGAKRGWFGRIPGSPS